MMALETTEEGHPIVALADRRLHGSDRIIGLALEGTSKQHPDILYGHQTRINMLVGGLVETDRFSMDFVASGEAIDEKGCPNLAVGSLMTYGCASNAGKLVLAKNPNLPIVGQVMDTVSKFQTIEVMITRPIGGWSPPPLTSIFFDEVPEFEPSEESEEEQTPEMLEWWDD